MPYREIGGKIIQQLKMMIRLKVTGKEKVEAVKKYLPDAKETSPGTLILSVDDITLLKINLLKRRNEERSNTSSKIPTLRELLSQPNTDPNTNASAAVNAIAQEQSDENDTSDEGLTTKNESNDENLQNRIELVYPDGFLTKRSHLDTPFISKDLINRRKYLIAQQEKREYNKMISSVAPQLSDSQMSIFPEITGSAGPGFRSSAVAMNMIIAAFTCFFAADYVCRQYDVSRTIRVGISTSVLVSILMIEMILFIIRANKADIMDKKRKIHMESTIFLESTETAKKNAKPIAQ